MTDPGFIYPQWGAPACVQAVCTTRLGGYSKGVWHSFNLADHVGDDAADVAANRELLCRTLDLPSAPYWLQQVHGCEVVNAGNTMKVATCDASVAFEPGVVCAVLTADCLPILLCSLNGDRVAAVHAGWRGLAAGVIEQTVESLGHDACDLLAWLGPAIGPHAFEVGVDVYDAFTSHDKQAADAFTLHNDRWHADLYLLARQRLSGLGVHTVSGGEFCTYSQSERFFSYRRSGVTGRMASLIWIR